MVAIGPSSFRTGENRCEREEYQTFFAKRIYWQSELLVWFTWLDWHYPDFEIEIYFSVYAEHIMIPFFCFIFDKL